MAQLSASEVMALMQESDPQAFAQQQQNLITNYTAKVDWNQEFVDALAAKAQSVKKNPHSKFGYALDRARRSVEESSMELRSRKDLAELKGVGDATLRILMDVLNKKLGLKSNVVSKGNNNNNNKNNNENKRSSTITSTSSSTGTTNPIKRTKSSSSSASLVRSNSIGSARDDPLLLTRVSSMEQNKKNLARQIRPEIAAATSPQPITHRLPSPPPPRLPSTTTTTSTTQIPSPPCSSSNVHSMEEDQHNNVLLESQVILLLDSREVGLQKSRHFFETNLRDRGIQVEVRGNLPLGDFLWIIRTPDHQEYVCDEILERKTAQDLAVSIKDGRYYEQKARLECSTCSHPIYLVEGNIQNVTIIPVSALETCIMETRLGGFFVKQTGNQDQTCDFIHHVHQSVQKKHVQGKYELNSATKYETFCSNTRSHHMNTVKQAFQAMLVQVPGMSVDKARALTELYPTPRSLVEDYFNPIFTDPKHRETRQAHLLENIEVGPTRRKFGPVLSKIMASLYCLDEYCQ